MNLFMIIIIYIAIIVASYIIGCINGFKKCKEIDDNAIRELTNKYKQQLEKML